LYIVRKRKKTHAKRKGMGEKELYLPWPLYKGTSHQERDQRRSRKKLALETTLI